MDTTLVITTKNRKEDLRSALRSAVRQTANLEILVMDDGSTDETPELVAREFPGVRLIRSELSVGYIEQRNRAAAQARGRFIVSLDDDAEFPSPNTIEQALGPFSHPRIGAVAIPYLEPRLRPGLLRQAPPDAHGLYVTHTFRGTAHAVRRDVFLRLGGYRSVLFHQGEENDFAIRLLDAGYAIGMCDADPLFHHESPRREWSRMDVFGRRNDILFAWQNVPMPYFPVHLFATTMNGMVHGARVRRPLDNIRGIVRGYSDLFLDAAPRMPVRRDTYLLFRRLKKEGPVSLDAIERLLPRQADQSSSRRP